MSPLSEKGFTLIELLVVIVLVGIIASMGGINLTNWLTEREAKQEIRKIQDHIRLLMDEAVISQSALALRINSGHIDIYERKGDKWQQAAENTYTALKLGEGIRLELIEQNDSALEEAEDQEDQPLKMIYLGADGRVSPYTLRVLDENTYCDLNGDLAGNMVLADCDKRIQLPL